MTTLFVILLVMGCASVVVGVSTLDSNSFLQFCVPWAVGAILVIFGITGLGHSWDKNMRDWLGEKSKPAPTVDQRMNKACKPHGGLIQAVEDQNVVVCVDGKAVKY